MMATTPGRRAGRIRLLGLALGLLLLARAGAEPYRFVVLPDSQNATQAFPEVLDATCDWIVANKAKLNIQVDFMLRDPAPVVRIPPPTRPAPPTATEKAPAQPAP